MKKISVILIAIVLAFCFAFFAFGEADGENSAEVPKPETASSEEVQDMSQPRFMVTGYKLSTESLKPSESSELEITFKNYSNKKALYNIKLSISDESGEIQTEGMPTAYVNAIYAGSTYVWKVRLSALPTAQIGQHKLTVTSEYEDKYYSSYSSCDTVCVNVTQSVELDFSGLELPSLVVQGDTCTVSAQLMNTGKTDLRNCKIDFEIDGLLNGGTMFIGEIPAGESGTGNSNLRVSSEKLGDVSGTATISFEDSFGKTYTKTAQLSTKIEKKVEQQELENQENAKKFPLWGVFLLLGIVLGGGVGCAVPISIYSRKQRKEDEMRL